MKRAALEFDPKAQLLRILEDYPGGQLVSEAVQNAEDGGASQFTLLLDLRHHAIEHQAIAGPAFVLIDNGRGFSEREWTSLRAVNKSEKRSSPSEIGAFGMGSRSYFHYSDVTLVASRGQYGGIDPLKVLPGRDGGWHASLSEGEIQAEADALFSPGVAGLCEGFDRMQRGALIRLPLRREQDVLREQEQSDDGQPLAPEITVARAEELFAQWADSAPRLLLFLTSMRRVSFYRWRSGAAQPELVADTNKKYLRGEPRPRLPPSLPDNVTRTYTELRDHILGLSASERAALSATQEAVVRVELSQPAPRGASRSVSAIDWFVCERLDFITPSVLGAMQKGCCRNATPVIPVVGIAMPLTADGVPFVGVPYCFLPIGQMRTGLPVQVNGSFRPTPNRRELWLPGEELDGNHEKFALWNEVLMNDAVPALWLAALRNLASAGIATTAGGIATTAGRQFDILSVLPDLAAVDNVWRPCAEKLYTLISGEPLLPHSGSRQWVMPREALGVVAPAALASQVKGVMRLYERCPDPALREQVALVSASAAPSAQAASTSRANCVVTLPKHVLDGCERFSALRRVRIDHVLRCVLRADRSAFEGPTAVDQLRPILLALMSYAGQAPFSSAEHGEWRGELAGVPWVETSGGATVKLSAAFAPSDALAKWQLGVVGSNTAQLGASDAATTLAGIAWGLKPGLSWADCVAEAQMIEKDRDRPLAERVAWAERLIKYLEHSFGTVGLFGPCEDEEATKCRALLSAIAFCPAVEPSGRFDSAASLEGTLCLRPPSSMQSSSNAPFVWAVEPRAKVSATLLRFAKLSVEVVVRQIIALSSMPAPSAEASVLSQHLLSAARRLSQFPPAELSPLSDSELGARLREAAWVPGMGGGKMGGGDQLRFFPPGRVAHQLHGDLWPRFGRLPDDWRAGLSTFLQTLGVKQTLSAAVLAAELRDVAGEGQHSKRFALSIRMAAELAAALEAGAAAPDEVFVPTTDGRLLPAAHVFINDAPWHSRAAGAATQALLHEAVSPADGKRLGCSSVREELARLCEGEGEVEGEVFGQSERLSTRIENLLLKYNDEKDLFVEHLQNCNDAGASKVLFMFDHGSYDAMSVIAPGHEALQGPALVLASSRALDDNDLLRIRQLGNSEKRKQFAQAGRFGLGLNSLYHLSDTPQIFAKNLAFVVLDPLHKLGGEDGMRYIPARLQENFPSMLAPFAAVPKEYPTVFRLPLRMLGPSSFGRKWSAKAAFDLLSRFIELQKSELLLFSKSVTQVVVDVRSSDGSVARLREIARTDTVDDDDTPLQSPRKSPRVAKRTAVAATSQAPVYVSSPFMQRLPTTFEEVRQLQGSPRDSIERVTIVIESPDAAPVKERWLIAHSLAVDGDGLGLIRDEEDHARAERDQDDGRAAVHARPAVGGSGRVGVACRIPKRWCGAGVGVVRLCRAGSAYRPLKSRPSVWNPTLSPRPFARRAAL